MSVIFIESDSEDDQWSGISDDDDDDIAPILCSIQSDSIMDKWRAARGVDAFAVETAARRLERARRDISALVDCRRAALRHLNIST